MKSPSQKALTSPRLSESRCRKTNTLEPLLQRSARKDDLGRRGAELAKACGTGQEHGDLREPTLRGNRALREPRPEFRSTGGWDAQTKKEVWNRKTKVVKVAEMREIREASVFNSSALYMALITERMPILTPTSKFNPHLRGANALVVVGMGKHGFQPLQQLVGPKGRLGHLLLGRLLDGVSGEWKGKIKKRKEEESWFSDW